MPQSQSHRLETTRDLTTGVVARMLDIAPQTVRGMCERGELPGARLIGRWWRIPASAVRKYLPEQSK